jgi:glucokinase
MLATAVSDPSSRPVVGVDLGGTTTKAALVSSDLEILARAEVPTDLDSEQELLDELEQLVATVRDGEDVAGVGFGLPSQIDQRRGRVADSTNVPLEEVDFVYEMRRRLGVPVAIDNDGNAACLAESRVGVAAGAQNVVMLTLGTGVGGGLVLDGRLYRGSTGCGAELGHMVIDENGPECPGNCPNHGCVEAFVSGRALGAAGALAAIDHPDSVLGRARAAGEEIDGRLVTEVAMAGDDVAIEVFAGVGRHLGVALAGYANIFEPDLIVIGGGVMAAGDLLLEPAREELRARALPPMNETRVVAAALGADAGMIGAAEMALEEVAS